MEQPLPSVLRPRINSQFREIEAGVSTRIGGVSKAPYASLNLGSHVGDAHTDVETNRRLFFASAGLQVSTLATMHQVHGSAVRVVEKPGHYENVDGLITAVPGIVLCVGIADCAAVLFFDPVRKVIGACHAGWRGVVADVLTNTVNGMNKLGSVTADLHVYISPCISVRHFEVGPEVAEQFDVKDVKLFPTSKNPHVDLSGAISRKLSETGIRSHCVEKSTYCTVGKNDVLFSYRAENGRTGRMMAFIVLHP